MSIPFAPQGATPAARGRAAPAEMGGAEPGPEGEPGAVASMDARSSEARSSAHALDAARRRLKLRALADAALLGAGVAAVPFLFSSTLDALVATLGAVGGAVVIYMARRGNDLERYAEEARARNERLSERGIPLSAWHEGAPLPSWEDRSCHRGA